MFCPYSPKDLVRRCLPLQTETEKNIKVLQHILKVMLLIDSPRSHIAKHRLPASDQLYCTQTPADGTRDELNGERLLSCNELFIHDPQEP